MANQVEKETLSDFELHLKEKSSRRDRLKNKRKRDTRNADKARRIRLTEGNGKFYKATDKKLNWDYMGNVEYGKASRASQKQEELLWQEAMMALEENGEE